MRRDVFAKESSWKENLAEKDAENARLRARIERMDRGLSSLFVKETDILNPQFHFGRGYHERFRNA